jgi:hypothetical protein
LAAPAKRNITEKHLFDFVWIGDPQMSPDGSRVTYVRVSVNEKKTGYDVSFLPEGSPCHPLAILRTSPNADPKAGLRRHRAHHRVRFR